MTYQYDQDFKGALSSVTSAGVSKTSYTHDGFGRVKASTQTDLSTNTPYSFTYAYSLTDQLTQITYPSGRTISYTLDAADRVTTVRNVAANQNYATLTYTAPGGIATMATGNGVTQQVSWNDRAQPTSLQVTSGAANLLTLGFYPCAGGATSCTSGNNGNLQSQSIAIPGLNLTQTYTYDKLNRLTAATEAGGVGWAQNYGYDVNGNRWVTANTNLPSLSLETPTSQSWFSGSSIPNRINTWSYDAAGNVTQVGGMDRHFTYDAENRQASFTINSTPSTYSYDGNGLRVKRDAGGVTTTYVYDAFGNLAAEYSTQAAPSACGTQTCYPVLDHHGSSNVTRYDYLPFGQEIPAGWASRTKRRRVIPHARRPSSEPLSNRHPSTRILLHEGRRVLAAHYGSGLPSSRLHRARQSVRFPNERSAQPGQRTGHPAEAYFGTILARGQWPRSRPRPGLGNP